MKKILHFLVFALMLLSLLLCCGCKSNDMVHVEPASEPDPVPEGPVGYKAAVPCGKDFLACGTGGRADLISIDGTVTSCETGTTENLNDVYVSGANVLVAGDHGTLLESRDGGKTFTKIDLGTDAKLYSCAFYNDTLFAAAEDGIIYRENSGGWEPVQMETENDIIGLAASNYCLAAITAQSDVFFSTDGQNWTHQDFNKIYDGLYPRYVFKRVIPAGETLFVIGYPEENPKHPLIMFTETGEVWQQKEMMKINGDYVDPEANLQIHDICFNIDQIVGVLDAGQVLAITECSTCNETLYVDSDKDLWATAVQAEGVLVCGEDFFSKVLDSKQIRQDKIGAEQAQIDVEMYGALLIDVREDDELAADGYIPGSIHVPLAQVAERLPELASDLNTEIIFYCASGKRSQKATEQAIDMGYTTVYNLGGLSDWPYEIVFDENPAQ